MIETATHTLPDGGTVTYLLDHPRRPEDIPAGLVAVHNVGRWVPGYAIAQMGFRVMIEPLDPDRAEPCGCPWAPEIGTHYRRRRVKR